MKKLHRILIISAISFGVSLALMVSGVMDGFELKAYDLFSSRFNPSERHDDIVIVEIDQQSIDSLSEQGITWPWPRQMYAPMVEQMSEADAVFMDILFTESSSYGLQDDMIFSEALEKASNVYLPVFLTNNDREMNEKDIGFLGKIRIKEDISAGMSYDYAIAPVNALKPSVRGAGNVTIPPDEDGVYRKVPLVFSYEGSIIPHFVLDYLLNEGIVSVRQGALYSDSVKIPLKEQRLNIRYSTHEEPFVRIPAVVILRSYLDSREAVPPSYEKGFFKGKKVFVGLTAAGLYDLKPTSISSVSTGVMIHAAALENIINKNFIRTISSVYVALFMLFICVFISYSVLRIHSFFANLLLFFISLFVTVLVPALLFKNAFYMNIISPSQTMIVAFVIAAAYSYATEGKERRFIKRTFSRYMDRNIVEYVLKNPGLIKPGGQMKRVTVFFADMAGFTSFAEKVPVEKTSKILYAVLNQFTETIIRNKGVIDKYIGDCVMAFWGAPLDTEKDEMNACYAALQCFESIEEINAALSAEGLPDISARIGIHTGKAIAGNLGSDRLFDYTVVGDTVNLSSRLESASKQFGTKIIVSEETLKKTEGLFFTRNLGRIMVKGKSEAVRIYELIGENSGVSAEKKEIVDMFEKARALLNDRKLQEARDSFEHILENFPADGPSEFYRQWCEYLMSAPELTIDPNIIKLRSK